uniref:Uncharacterized protein n=1 Tax=Candidatus Kentrum sp. LFY TaxID=2126342 RepID=A0A450U8X3_9GAMM|nr:MAG: hypothetical protein BECKLFY1418B_GA0070995_101022 [Candidatus Kentron sp. LFY]VFJ91533.1 MAG: hypothetical protein BECKLFY1418A_GA0070994_101636 [Candidatus Kentron sp. LFY]
MKILEKAMEDKPELENWNGEKKLLVSTEAAGLKCPLKTKRSNS